MKKKYIIITSIFDPTEAVIKFSKLEDHKVLVIGDKKTPLGWNCENVEYLSVNKQEKLSFSLNTVLPYNHYSRKMLGYLLAIENGADYIIDTDDDNIPKNDWKFPNFEQKYECIESGKGFINVYQLYTDQNIWPRGLPLSLISKEYNLEQTLKIKDCNIGIWQGLADEDPDVDAIYRLTMDTPCYFKQREPIALGSETISPFNSQNTMIRKELFPLLYLPTYVTFRFTDILRGLVAQPIMWLYGYQLGFVNATVTQKRNPHDYMKDFISEIPMYQHCESVIEIVKSIVSVNESIENNLYNSYVALKQENIVCSNEITSLEYWLKDLSNLK